MPRGRRLSLVQLAAPCLAAMITAATTGACQTRAPATFHVVGAAAAATEWTGSRSETDSSGALEGGLGALPTSIARSSVLDAGDAKPWVLHIGDSFVEAFFKQNLAPRFRAAGARYVVQGETATVTTSWASNPELDSWLELRPSLVLITLGANEVTLPVPEMRARAVERLVQRIAAVAPSCVWITPLTWKGDTGILKVIHDHSRPCLFFDSDAVVGELSASERQPQSHSPKSQGGCAVGIGLLGLARRPSRRERRALVAHASRAPAVARPGWRLRAAGGRCKRTLCMKRPMSGLWAHLLGTAVLVSMGACAGPGQYVWIQDLPPQRVDDKGRH